ncbi:hypothetical protein PVAP13_5NG253400 [Panicum virgatum]|uniref:Uncharacterized protein n=1 Tax=Panicum virgatum TaxID=38727 RepID=A0A8T0RW82_PANVG|nr:hypothetical protein PVAP13_5NG253400 [Panicum virgatum]
MRTGGRGLMDMDPSDLPPSQTRDEASGHATTPSSPIKSPAKRAVKKKLTPRKPTK